MALGRDDRWLADAQGRALAGAQVYYCLQPASTSATSPSPLATVFSSITGAAGTNPLFTDGFGHSVAYVDDSVLYTIVLNHPLFGPNPVVLIDQAIGGGGGGGTTVTAFAGIPSGAIDGTNRTFTFAVPVAPSQTTVWLNFPLIVGLGYTASWAGGTLTVVYSVAPQPLSGPVAADSIYVQGFYEV